jgi:hypothetical protein
VTSGSGALGGTWTSTGAGTDGGTQLPDNQITYTPAAGVVGTDTFAVPADVDGDGIFESILNVTITIDAVTPIPQPSSATVAANSTANPIPLITVTVHLIQA